MADSDSRRYPSLDQALAARIPQANHALVRQFTDSIGISDYVARSGYVKAIRSGGGPDLHIASGWTNGFASEAEARTAAGPRVKVWRSASRPRTWGVDHPENGMGHGGGGSRPEATNYGVCPVHQMRLPASGQCDDCL